MAGITLPRIIFTARLGQIQRKCLGSILEAWKYSGNAISMVSEFLELTFAAMVVLVLKLSIELIKLGRRFTNFGTSSVPSPKTWHSEFEYIIRLRSSHCFMGAAPGNLPSHSDDCFLKHSFSMVRKNGPFYS